jgi:hypothetical protein
MRYPITSMLLCLVVFAILALGCRGCPPKPPPPNSNGNASPESSAKPSTKTPSDSTVRRVGANVMAGENAPLTLLTDDEPHDLTTGTKVNTDPQGEARLELAGCDTVYLFQLSKMSYAPCSKSDSISAGVSCLEGGTAVYNSECAGRIEQLIQTPTQNITPKGTWFSVTYFPDQQMTITLVMKGSVEVRPVISMENRTLGEPVVVSEGQTYATVPAKPGQEDFGHIADLREVRSAADLPAELKMQLSPWADRIQKHAKEDGVAFDKSVFSNQSGWPIDCDCGHVQAGLLTKQYYEACLKRQLELIDQYRRNGTVTGTCDGVAQGPDAKPKG